MILRHLSDDWAPAWHCPTCEVGWASPQVFPLCWHCRRRGVLGNVKALVSWWVPS